MVIKKLTLGPLWAFFKTAFRYCGQVDVSIQVFSVLDTKIQMASVTWGMLWYFKVYY